MSNSLKNLELSSEELKEIATLLAKKRDIRGCKSMSENELLRSLTSSKPVKKGKKPKTNFCKTRIEKIRKEFNE